MSSRPSSRSPGDRPEVAAAHVGADLEAPREVLALDRVRCRRNAHVGHVRQQDRLAARRVDRKPLDARQARARLGRAPDVDVVRPAAAEDVADLFARDPGAGGAANVAGLHAVALRLGEIDLDLDLRDIRVQLHLRFDETVDALHQPLHLGCLLGEDVEVVAEHADDDCIARAGEHLPDPLLQVGLDVALDPRVTGDDLLHARQRLVVVDLRIDADPVLAEIDAVRLVGQERLADVRTAVAHARDAPELSTGPDRDPRLLRARACPARSASA